MDRTDAGAERSAAEPLAERLVQVTLDLLDEQGLDALTLRHIARRAGVSHGAPLRHFESRADLLSEVAAHGFRALSEAVEKAAALLPPRAGPIERLRAGARAYVACAVARPGLFALMFRPELLEPQNARYREHGLAAFDQLRVRVREAQASGWHPDREARVVAAAMWGALHGLATLWAQGAFHAPVPGVTLEQALAATLDLMLGDLPSGDRPGGDR